MSGFQESWTRGVFALLPFPLSLALHFSLHALCEASTKRRSCLFQVDEKSTRHGGEIVAEVLKAHGVRYVFTLVGGHISPILVASEKLGIHVVDTRHEATAVFAADAVARLSGTYLVPVLLLMEREEAQSDSVPDFFLVQGWWELLR